MKELARLSDKYMIDSLQKDLRVLFLTYVLIMSQNYVQVTIARKDIPTFEIWKFAAEYSFLELKEYCRSDDFVFVILKDILCRPQGLQTLLKYRIPTKS